ncbi:MAG TPA: hypothetical protein VES42_22355 [Pilimelia sp.]|nr:hypothetical protein [Pilimelia sp.]
MFKRFTALALLSVTVLTLGLQQPASADIGPEGYPVVQGETHRNQFTIVGGNVVMTPLSRAYQWLDRGRAWTFGNVELVLHTTGDLKIHPRGNRGVTYWSTGTAGSGATQLLFQRDGNLVLYTAGYEDAVWSSKTNDRCARSQQLLPALSLQSDSNMVVYCFKYEFEAPEVPYQKTALWSTRTSGR